MSKRNRSSSPSSDINNFEEECSRNSKMRIWDHNDICDDPKDFFKQEHIKSSSLTSLYFGNLLQAKRMNEIVLPKVFGILAKFYEIADQNDNTSPYMETNVNSIPWERSQDDSTNTYPMTGLLKCRLVCKSWNEAIQSVFESFPRFQFRMDLNPPKESFIFSHATQRFDQEGSVLTPQKFITHFDTTHYDYLEDKPKKNPFMGRCVSITTFRDRANFQAHFEGILEILRKYGPEVWYFRFIFYDESEGGLMQLADFYRKLKQLTVLMPSLQLLYISFCRRAGRGGNHSLSTPGNCPNFHQLVALEQEINENSFIKLPKLKFLSTEYIPPSIFNQLITQNDHISQLEVRRQSFHGCYQIFSRHLSNLMELSLELCTLSDLTDLENCQVPLKLGKLHLYYEDPAPFVPWSRVFTALENNLNREVCTELLLKLPVPISNLDRELVLGESLGCRLNLPQLQSITLFKDALFCLDFVLSSKNTLRDIVIRNKNNSTRRLVGAVHRRNEYADFEEKQIIKFLGWNDKMEKSNIPVELPRVKMFTFIFMRHGGLSDGVRYEFGTNQVNICKLD